MTFCTMTINLFPRHQNEWHNKNKHCATINWWPLYCYVFCTLDYLDICMSQCIQCRCLHSPHTINSESRKAASSDLFTKFGSHTY